MKSKNIIIVDMISGHGHIPFNKCYLEKNVFNGSLFLTCKELFYFYKYIKLIEI